MVTDTFRDTPPMPPHLLAIFVFNDFENVTEFTMSGHMVSRMHGIFVILFI